MMRGVNLKKENIRLKSSAKQAITTIRKNNSKKYFSLLSTYGKGYADAYIFSIFSFLLTSNIAASVFQSV